MSTGEAIAVVMADGSDSPADLVTYYQKLLEGYDCAFGSRFVRGGATAPGIPRSQTDPESDGELVHQVHFQASL